MGHWARIDDNNIVQEVIVIKEAELDTGNWGDKSKWIKTSYNTKDGKHYVPDANQNYTVESTDQSKALRYRYAGIGMKYDAVNDVFHDPTPPNPDWSSWTFDTTTWSWKPPIPMPEITKEEFKYWVWDEDEYQADTGDPKTKGWVAL